MQPRFPREYVLRHHMSHDGLREPFIATVRKRDARAKRWGAHPQQPATERDRTTRGLDA
jgi:hypothetical protein